MIDVPRDGACQFAAILHALTTQLHPPRAASHDVLSLRHALTDFLHGRQVQFYHGPTPNVAAVLRLFQFDLGPTVLRVGETFFEWSDRMRLPREWGDAATLLAAAALFRVRIHVISRASQAGEQLLRPLLFRPRPNGPWTMFVIDSARPLRTGTTPRSRRCCDPFTIETRSSKAAFAMALASRESFK